jgi:enoyl-CoA hydratase/carnithine racemase
VSTEADRQETVNHSRTGSPLVLASGPDDDGVTVITLNRPEKKNALSIVLREEALREGILRS